MLMIGSGGGWQWNCLSHCVPKCNLGTRNVPQSAGPLIDRHYISKQKKRPDCSGRFFESWLKVSNVRRDRHGLPRDHRRHDDRHGLRRDHHHRRRRHDIRRHHHRRLRAVPSDALR